MAKTFRQLMESVVYAGLKPGAPRSQARRMKWLGPLRRPLELLLNVRGSDDPFYLTNRTLEQRVRFWLLISLPCVVVAAGIAFGVLGFIQKRDAPPQELTPAQIAAKMLPDLNRPIDLNVNTEIELLEVRVARTEPMRLVGEVHNRTDRAIAHAEMVFDVTDARGSRLGAVSVPVDRIPPNTTVPFLLPIEQRTAAFALVRELRTQ
jgi:hypothetical protein